MIKKLLAVFSERRSRIQEFTALEKAGRVEIGRHSYALPRLVKFEHDLTRLTVGNFVSMAGGVTFILGGNHPTDRITTFPIRSKFGLDGAGTDGYPYTKGDITVGHDVWIGYGATVLSGVTIGNGAVVAAGSLVTRDVAPFAIVAGIPAKFMRHRFDEETIARIQALEWWLWGDEEIARRVEELTAPLQKD
jgi:acetyltransferase-like isoleucine patch superfamily enzyme